MTQQQWLLVQLRLLADSNGDSRSLVAIAAQFERDADALEIPNYLKLAIKRFRHCRNVDQAA
jgi:hypothetical protein